MGKNILESHNASKLESRLNKHRYLSKKGLPGAADAKVYEALKASAKIPERKLYPNIYHWFILIRQFSDTARDKWISNEAELEEVQDQLISDLLSGKQDAKSSKIRHIKEEPTESDELARTEINLRISPTKPAVATVRQDANDLSFFLNVFSKEDIAGRLQELQGKPSQGNQGKLGIKIIEIKIEENAEGKNFFICFKATPSQCQSLKDYVSNWPEILSFHIKRHKKNTPQETRQF